MNGCAITSTSVRQLRLRAGECVRAKSRFKELHFVHPNDNAHDVMGKMEELDISQMPVFEDGEPMGSITEDNLVTLVLQGYDLRHTKVRDVMESSFPIVEPVTPIDQISGLLRGDTLAVFVRMGDGFEIITKYDVVHTIAGMTDSDQMAGAAGYGRVITNIPRDSMSDVKEAKNRHPGGARGAVTRSFHRGNHDPGLHDIDVRSERSGGTPGL